MYYVIWNNEVLVETESVLEKIYQILIKDISVKALTPTPLPRAGEGRCLTPK